METDENKIESEENTIDKGEIIETPVNPEEQFVRADTGKRFLNYLIDVAAFYLLIIMVSLVYFTMSPSALEETYPESSGFNLGDRLLSLFFYAIYMGIVEALFRGKSLGKLITKTRAVDFDGYPVTPGLAFSRAFCRAVPFCPLSAFGNPCNPWQDRWTDTMVIDETKTTYLQDQSPISAQV